MAAEPPPAVRIVASRLAGGSNIQHFTFLDLIRGQQATLATRTAITFFYLMCALSLAAQMSHSCAGSILVDNSFSY
jgi:hypothetical protein